jgi:transposase InsO family protein
MVVFQDSKPAKLAAKQAYQDAFAFKKGTPLATHREKLTAAIAALEGTVTLKDGTTDEARALDGFTNRLEKATSISEGLRFHVIQNATVEPESFAEAAVLIHDLLPDRFERIIADALEDKHGPAAPPKTGNPTDKKRKREGSAPATTTTAAAAAVAVTATSTPHKCTACGLTESVHETKTCDQICVLHPESRHKNRQCFTQGAPKVVGAITVPNAQAPAAQPASPNPAHTVEDATGKDIILYIEVGPERARCKADSGAEISLITGSFVKKLRSQGHTLMPAGESTFVVASGHTVKAPHVWVDGRDAQQRRARFRAAIVSDRTNVVIKGCNVLLSRDAAAAFGVTMCRDGISIAPRDRIPRPDSPGAAADGFDESQTPAPPGSGPRSVLTKTKENVIAINKSENNYTKPTSSQSNQRTSAPPRPSPVDSHTNKMKRETDDMAESLETRVGYRPPKAVPWVPTEREFIEIIAFTPTQPAVAPIATKPPSGPLGPDEEKGSEPLGPDEEKGSEPLGPDEEKGSEPLGPDEGEGSEPLGPIDAPGLGTLLVSEEAPAPAHPDHVTVQINGIDLTIGRELLELRRKHARLAEALARVAAAARANRDAKKGSRLRVDCGVVLELLPGETPWPYPPKVRLLSNEQKEAILSGMQKLVDFGAVSVVRPPEGAPPGWYPKAAPGEPPIAFVPIFAVSQKEGKTRIVADCRALNRKLAPSVPAPAVPTHEYLDKLTGSTMVISQCDLKKAYVQIGIDKTAGCRVMYPSPDGTFWWEAESVPTGAKTSPGALHAWITAKLAHLPAEILKAVQVYADNLYFSTEKTGNTVADMTHHLNIVATVLEALTDEETPATIDFSASGSQFCVKTMDVLGVRVGEDGRRITPSRLVELEDYETEFPTTVGGLSSLVGKLHFVISMVPGLATLAEPLRPPPGTRGDVATLAQDPRYKAWTEGLRPAYKHLMDAIRAAPPLAKRDYSKPAIIFCDGSSYGRAAALCNLLHLGPIGDGKYEAFEDRPGVFRIGESEFQLVVLASAITPAEHAHKSAPLLEIMALSWALAKFQPFYGGYTPHVATDSQALAAGILGSSNNEGLMARRAIDVIDSFGAIEVTYIPGKVHPADGLSRLPLHTAGTARRDGQETLRSHIKQRQPKIAPNESALLAQRIKDRSHVVAAITRAKATTPNPPPSGPPTAPQPPAPPQAQEPPVDTVAEPIPVVPQFVPLREVIIEGKRIPPIAYPTDPWVPGQPLHAPGTRELKKEIMTQAHEGSAHPGRDAVLDSLRALGYGWSGMFDDVGQHIHNCPTCLTAKHSNRKPLSAPRSYTNGKVAPWVSVHCDVMHIPGPTAAEPRYAYVIADRFSSFLIAEPLAQNTAAETAKVFKSMTAVLGNPSVVVTDNGPETEGAFHALLENRGIRHDRSTALHKQGNGIAERAIRSLRSIMRTGIGENDQFGQDWVDHLHDAAYHYNIRLNKRIGLTPAQAFLGRSINLAPPIIPASLNAPKHDEDTLEDLESVAEAIERVKRKMAEDHERHERIVADDAIRRSKTIAKFIEKHGEQPVLKVGDFVSILATNRHKTQHPGTWPPRKIAAANDGTYTLYKMDQHTVERSRKYKIDQLKIWKGEPPAPLFVVRDVIAAKVTQEAGKKVVRVLIAWKDYPKASDRSWEPVETIRSSIPNAIMRKFERLTAPKLASI